MPPDEKMIVALDFESVTEATNMAHILRDKVRTFKVGMELGYDPDRDHLLRVLKSQGSRIFLDLKLHDIGDTIERTVRKIAKAGNVDMLTVYGYPETMMAAAKGAEGTDLEIYAITVLTSLTEASLRSCGYTVTMRSLVGQRTDYAVLANLAGVVCAVEDAKAVRNWSRESLKIISPGIRLPNTDTHGQARTATPSQAMKAKVDQYVVGRPITRSESPLDAVDLLLADAVSAK